MVRSGSAIPSKFPTNLRGRSAPRQPTEFWGYPLVRPKTLPARVRARRAQIRSAANPASILSTIGVLCRNHNARCWQDYFYATGQTPRGLSAMPRVRSVRRSRVENNSTSRLPAYVISTSASFATVGMQFSGARLPRTCLATCCFGWWLTGSRPIVSVIWTVRASACSTTQARLRRPHRTPWIWFGVSSTCGPARSWTVNGTGERSAVGTIPPATR
jgi:hypothetical protein